jgi:hypothetical protein
LFFKLIDQRSFVMSLLQIPNASNYALPSVLAMYVVDFMSHLRLPLTRLGFSTEIFQLKLRFPLATLTLRPAGSTWQQCVRGNAGASAPAVTLPASCDAFLLWVSLYLAEQLQALVDTFPCYFPSAPPTATPTAPAPQAAQTAQATTDRRYPGGAGMGVAKIAHADPEPTTHGATAAHYHSGSLPGDVDAMTSGAERVDGRVSTSLLLESESGAGPGLTLPVELDSQSTTGYILASTLEAHPEMLVKRCPGRCRVATGSGTQLYDVVVVRLSTRAGRSADVTVCVLPAPSNVLRAPLLLGPAQMALLGWYFKVVEAEIPQPATHALRVEDSAGLPLEPAPPDRSGPAAELPLEPAPPDRSGPAAEPPPPTLHGRSGRTSFFPAPRGAVQLRDDAVSHEDAPGISEASVRVTAAGTRGHAAPQRAEGVPPEPPDAAAPYRDGTEPRRLEVPPGGALLRVLSAGTDPPRDVGPRASRSPAEPPDTDSTVEAVSGSLRGEATHNRPLDDRVLPSAGFPRVSQLLVPSLEPPSFVPPLLRLFRLFRALQHRAKRASSRTSAPSPGLRAASRTGLSLPSSSPLLIPRAPP